MTHFRHNMTRSEFLDWLRYSAIAGDMPPQFIDRIDDLEALLGVEAELAEVAAKLERELERHGGGDDPIALGRT